MTTTATELTGTDESGVPVPGRKVRGGGGLGSYLLIRFLLIFPTVFIAPTLPFLILLGTLPLRARGENQRRRMTSASGTA